MQIRFVVVTLLAATTASAEPHTAVSPEPTAYVAAGGAIGGAEPAGLGVLAAFEGGYRLASSPFWIHGELTTGTGGDDQGSGDVSQGRAGIEARACWTPPMCGIAGVDLGGHHGTWVQDRGSASETTNALVAVPRAVFDLGGDRLRVRLGIEVSLGVGRHRKQDAGGDSETGVSGVMGAEATLGLGYAW